MATTTISSNEIQMYQEYERCLLSTLLLDGPSIDSVTDRITVEHFFTPIYKKLYVKICDQWKTDKCVDPIGLIDNNKITAAFIAEVTNANSSSGNLDFYVKKLQEFYAYRSLKGKVAEVIENLTPQNVYHSSEEIDKALSNCVVNPVESYKANGLMINITEEIQKTAMRKDPLTGFASGFEDLDTALDGFQKSTMYVIGARPSIGKTAFALALVKGLAEKGAKVSVFSLEMSAKSLGYRMIAADSGIPMWQIKKGLVLQSAILMEKTQRSITKIYDLPFTVMDNGVDSDRVLYSKIRHEARINHTDVVVIDHLGLIEVAESTGQRYVDVGCITKTLHKMAKELNICIILLAQCGRGAEGKKPNLSLLRESGNIEQDGDVIMLLHRQRTNSNNNKKKVELIPTDVIVAKNRDGATPTSHFLFEPLSMKFIEDKSDREDLDEEGSINSITNRKEKKNDIPL